MPKPRSNPARKKSTWSSANYNSGNRPTTDVEQSHANNAQKRRNEIQQRKDTAKAGKVKDRQMRQTDTGNVVRNRNAKAEQHRRMVEQSGRVKDRQMRQTDTGHTIRNKQIKEQRRREQLKDFNPNENAQKIDQYTDNNTSRKGGRKHYGNAEATKRAMKEKYGDRNDWKLSPYERIDIKGRELEDKIKRKWKPSDVSYKRPDEAPINMIRSNNASTNTKRHKSSNSNSGFTNALTLEDLRRAGQELRKGGREISRAVNDIGSKAEKAVRKHWKPSDVSSKRFDEQGNREWKKHKYIDKVRTKSGKIRYIYNIEGGGSSHEDAGKTMRKNQNSKAASQINYNMAQARKAARSAGSKAKAFLSKLFG